MKLTAVQKATAQAIANIHETSSVRGDYGNITLIRGDSGRLTYGRSQTTNGSGNLYKLVDDYTEAPGAVYAEGLKPFLPGLQSRSTALDTNLTLRKLLADAGDKDPVMRSVQDAFFDRVYWAPAVDAADRLGIQTALGMAIVYDSYIHGSFQRMAQRTTDHYGSVRMATEKTWLRGYIATRKAWLTSCGKPLSNTIYRMRTFEQLMASGNWDLDLPLSAWGYVVSLATMGISESEDDAWTLYLNDDKLGTLWQNPDDAFRNYFPARELLEKLHGVAETGACLQYESGALEWSNEPMNVPALLRTDGKVWGQVRALAGASSLVVERDVEARTLRLSRQKETT